MMYQVMGLIDNAFAMCGLQHDDVRKVTVRWMARRGVITWRVKIGIYKVGWRLEHGGQAQ